MLKYMSFFSITFFFSQCFRKIRRKNKSKVKFTKGLKENLALEKIFKYMIEFMINIPIIKDKND
jgi:hypothetical protein